MEIEKFKCMYSYDVKTKKLIAYSIYWKGKFVGELTLDGKTFKREIKKIPKELLIRVDNEMEEIQKESGSQTSEKENGK